MSVPAMVDIPIYHGDTLQFTISIAEDVDLSGHTPKFQIRSTSGTLLKDWSEFVSIDGPQLIVVKVPGEPDADGTFGLTRPAKYEKLNYDLQLTAPVTGTVRTLMRGKAILTGDVSYG